MKRTKPLVEILSIEGSEGQHSITSMNGYSCRSSIYLWPMMAQGAACRTLEERLMEGPWLRRWCSVRIDHNLDYHLLPLASQT